MNRRLYTTIEVDHRGSREKSNADEKEEEHWNDFFRFRPTKFWDSLVAKIKRQGGPKQKRDYCVDFFRRGFARIKSWPLRRFVKRRYIVAAVVAVATFAAVPYGIGFLKFLATEHEGTVAIFTVILALITLVQAVTTWLEFDQIKAANQRTDTMIEHVRLESRAWIAALQPEIKKFTIGLRIECIAILKNTGKTPAKIVDTAVKIILLPAAADFSGLNTDEGAAESKPVRNVVPPEGILHITDDEDVILTAEMNSDINRDYSRLWFFGKVYYRDVAEGKLRKTLFCFYWNPHAQMLYAHDKANDMT